MSACAILTLVGLVLAVGSVTFTMLMLAALRFFRLPSGMPYLDAVAALHREAERRGSLLAAWATSRSERIARLERATPPR